MSYCICKINCILGLVIKIDDMAFLDSKNAFWAVSEVTPKARLLLRNRFCEIVQVLCKLKKIDIRYVISYFGQNQFF